MAITPWIKKWRRAHRGLPLEIIQFNAMGSGAAQDVKRSIRILRDAAATGADVLTGVETQLIPPHAITSEKWHVVHRAGDYDKEGVFFALKRNRGRILNVEWRLGTKNRLGARRAVEMRDRWILIVTYVVDEGTPYEHKYRHAVAHMPPKRNWFLWPVMINNMVRARAAIYSSDFNKLARAVGPALRCRTFMIDIVGFAVRRRYPVNGPKRVNLRADHAGVIIVIWPQH